MTAVAKDTPLGPQQVAIIRPGQGLFDLDLGAVWRYRELLFVLIKRDIQVLYKQAALGAGWAIIQPLFAVLIFTIVFGWFAKMPSDGIPYPVFAFAAVLPWTYFAEATRRASTGLVDDAELIRKVYFPRLIMPLAKVTAPLLDFCISCVVMIGLMMAYGMVPSVKILLIFPLVLVASLLALSIALLLGPINVRFRDIKHTVPFMLQVWMYASPIVYPLSQVPDEFKVAYSLNPMVGVIEGFRWAVFDRGQPDFLALGMSLGIILVLLVCGLIYFKQQERQFADVI
jgi:lipopolysaccharide transport system permease protein